MVLPPMLRSECRFPREKNFADDALPPTFVNAIRPIWAAPTFIMDGVRAEW